MECQGEIKETNLISLWNSFEGRIKGVVCKVTKAKVKVIVKDVEGMAQRKSLKVEGVSQSMEELHSEFSITLRIKNRR
jgi:hypothetical protein